MDIEKWKERAGVECVTDEVCSLKVKRFLIKVALTLQFFWASINLPVSQITSVKIYGDRKNPSHSTGT